MKISKRWKYFLLSIGSFLLICVALVIWAFVVEPNRLTVNEVTIELPNWPPSLNGLRVALISDLHVGSPYINNAKLQYIVQTTNATQPDLILLAGDFMVINSVRGGHTVEPEIIAAELKNLRARFGVFAVLGNHDWEYDGERVSRALKSAGIRVLENEAVPVQQQGQSLWIAGVADAWTRSPDIKATLQQVTDNGPVIMLTHNPDIFPDVPGRVSLTLAGHTHGGQVNIPFFGSTHTPSIYKQRYSRGLVVEDGRHLFVTSGIGTSIYPVRFRVPPEIALLTLTAQVAAKP